MATGETVPSELLVPVPQSAAGSIDPLTLVRTEEAEVIRRRLAGATFEQIAEELFHPFTTAVYRFYAGLSRLRNHPDYLKLNLSGKLAEWVAAEPTDAETIARLQEVRLSGGLQFTDFEAELEALVKNP